MKCIVYISRVVERRNGATIPAGLSEIYHVARKLNAKHEVTGVLSYCKGHYIQVIEGNNAQVNQLYNNIASDVRHERVIKLLEVEIRNRSFPGWSMKLLTSVDKNIHFEKFVTQHLSFFESLPQDKLKLLGIFYKFRSTSDKPTPSYEGKQITLTNWPDFTLMEQSSALIDLCARLTIASQSYKYLLDGRYFETQKQLDKVLSQLDDQGILEVIDSNPSERKPKYDRGSRGFYSKMRQFLRI